MNNESSGHLSSCYIPIRQSCNFQFTLITDAHSCLGKTMPFHPQFSKYIISKLTCTLLFLIVNVPKYCNTNSILHFEHIYGTPLQQSCLENPMGGGAWWAAVHGVAKSPTRLKDFTFTFHFHALEKEMAIHSSVLAQRITGMAEPGGLPSMGLHRVGYN